MSDRETREEIRVAVREAFTDELKKAVREALDGESKSAVWETFGGELYSAVKKAVEDAVNEKINDAVREIRAGQRWATGITLAVILGVLSIGAPLAVGRITAELRASTVEAEADHVEEIARYDERLKAVE